MLSVINVFFIFNILVYSQSDGKYAACLRIILKTLHQTPLYACMDFILFLWISSLRVSVDFYGFQQFCSKSESNIINRLFKSDRFILFRMTQSLKLWQNSLLTKSGQYYYGTIWNFMRQKVQKTSSPGVIVQSVCEHFPLVIHVLIGINPHSHLFVFIIPLTKLRWQNFCKMSRL